MISLRVILLRLFFKNSFIILCVFFSASCTKGPFSLNVAATQPTWNSSLNAAFVANYKTNEYNNSGAVDGYGLNAIKAAEAYALLQSNNKPIGGVYNSGTRVTVGVADSGIIGTHPELTAAFNASKSSGFVGGSNSNYTDGYGQGTEVASIIAANRNGAGGLYGVAFASELAVAKVMNDSGGGTETDLISGINYLAGSASGKAVIAQLDTNLASPSTNLYNAINVAKNYAVIVAPAGDVASSTPGTNPVYPAAYAPDFGGAVLAVVAVDSNNALYSTSTSSSNQCGTAEFYCLAAPGVNIYSAKLGNAYGDVSGTAIAAAYVTGAAAVIKAAWPNLTNRQIGQILLKSATPLTGTATTTGADTTFGRGLLNLQNAVQAEGQNTIVFTSSFVSGAGYNASTSSISTSSIFGDAYSNNIAPILKNTVFFDDYGRDYNASLDSKINTAPNNYSLENLMFNNVSYAVLPSSSFGNNFKLGVLANNISTDPFTGETKINKLGLKYLAYDKSSVDNQALSNANLSFSYLGKITSDLKFGFSNNDLNNSYNSNDILNKFGFIAAQNSFSPFLSLARRDLSNSTSTGLLNQKQFYVSQNLSKNLTSGFSYFSSSSTYALQGSAMQNQGMDSKLNYQMSDNLNFGISYGSLEEYNNNFLGSKSYGAFTNSGSTNSNYVKFSTTKKLTDNFYLLSSYSEGRTKINGNDTGIFRDFHDVKSRSYSVGLLNDKIFGGRAGMIYNEPLRVYSGTVDINIPVGIDADGNIQRLQANNVSLKPTGRERDIEFFYGYNISEFSKIDLNFLIQTQPSNIKDAPNRYLGMVKYKLNF